MCDWFCSPYFLPSENRSAVTEFISLKNSREILCVNWPDEYLQCLQMPAKKAHFLESLWWNTEFRPQKRLLKWNEIWRHTQRTQLNVQYRYLDQNVNLTHTGNLTPLLPQAPRIMIRSYRIAYLKSCTRQQWWCQLHCMFQIHVLLQVQCRIKFAGAVLWCVELSNCYSTLSHFWLSGLCWSGCIATNCIIRRSSKCAISGMKSVYHCWFRIHSIKSLSFGEIFEKAADRKTLGRFWANTSIPLEL